MPLSPEAERLWRELRPMLATMAGDVATATLRRYPGVHVQQATVMSFDPRLGRADIVADGPGGGTQISQVDVASIAPTVGERVWIAIWPPHAPLVIGRVGSESAGCGTAGPQPEEPGNVATGIYSCAEGFESTASGDYSFAIGDNDTASGFESAVLGGDGNVASADQSGCFAGDGNDASAKEAVCVGGNGHQASGIESACIGGDGNRAIGNSGAICAGGNGNRASGDESGCVAGSGNESSGLSSGCIAGSANNATGERCIVAAGDSNTTDSDRTAIVAGNGNYIDDQVNEAAAILAGNHNTITNGSADSVVLGGNGNTIDGGSDSAVSGDSNVCNADRSLISGSGNLAKTGATGGLAIGEGNVIEEGVVDCVVEGLGAVAWMGTAHHAHADSGTVDIGGGVVRSTGQYSRFPSAFSAGAGVSTTIGDIQFDDYPYAAHITGDLIARDDIADVVSVWTIDAIVAADGSGGWRFVGAATATLVAQDAGAVAWTAAPQIDGSGLFNVAVTGDGTDPTDWSITLHLTDVLGNQTV